MFNDSDSFFYSPTGDLTNTLQRQFSGKYDTADPLWKRVRNGSIHDKYCKSAIICTCVSIRNVGSYCFTGT